MSYKILEGKKGIVFGALDNNSIAWKTAEAINDSGGKIVLTNAPIAIRMGKINELSKKLDCPIVPADATSVSDLQNLIDKSVKHFNGKIDFVLHSIGMSVNVRKGKKYTDLNYDWLKKGWDISAVSFHCLLYTSDAADE